MLAEVEISGLRKTFFNLKRRLAGFGEKEASGALMLAQRLKGLIAELDSTIAREKSLYNAALITRMKLAKKGYKLSKGVLSFEREVADEFEKGKLSENMGRRLILVIRHIKGSDLKEAKKEFVYLEEYIELNRQYGITREALEEKERALKREEHRVVNVLQEMADLENQSVDQEKVRRHEELSKDIALLEKAREAYICSLLLQPVAKLLNKLDAHPLKDRIPLMPQKDELSALENYFSRYPQVGGSSIEELCSLFDLSEKRLSHTAPDVAGFKKIVGERRRFFESIRSLRQSGFLAIDIDDEAMLDHFASGVDGTQDTISRIRALKANRRADLEEYERSARIEAKKAELAQYTKEGLEDELQLIRRLITFLGSEPVEEERKEGGFFKMLGSLPDKLFGR